MERLARELRQLSERIYQMEIKIEHLIVVAGGDPAQVRQLTERLRQQSDALADAVESDTPTDPGVKP